MKILAHFIAIITILFTATILHAEDSLLENEALGKIKLGQKSNDLIKIIGRPESQGQDMMWEAIGEWVQEWEYPAQGLSLKMASPKQKAAKRVLMLNATRGCQLATKRGIKIGSSEADVRKAYGEVESKENTRPGKTFVAGSIFGGVIFTFKKGKVSEIFIGAAAE